ncbi:MAG: CopD family protein [Gemmatimonadota bacterium]
MGAALFAVQSGGGSESFGAESGAYVLIRWLTFAATLVLVGVAVWNARLGPILRVAFPESAELAGRRVVAMARGFAVLLTVASLLRLLAQAVAFFGAGAATDLSNVGLLVGGTTWGWAWLMQMIASLVLVFGGSRRLTSPAVTGAAAAGLALALALSGHAAAVEDIWMLAVAIDALHVVGGGGWLGTLAIIVFAGLPGSRRGPAEGRAGAVAMMVNAFSPLALAFAGVTASTGIVASWLQVNPPPWSALWDTLYGQRLLIKVGFVALVAAVGAWNWRRVKPRLDAGGGPERLRRSAVLELVLSLVVLLVTALLVATAPPYEGGG